MTPSDGGRLRRALDTHGARGLPFAVARRSIDKLEKALNPRHVNRFDTGDSPVVASSEDPVAALYRVEFQTLVIELPLSVLRWSRMGLRLDDPAGNPFLHTVVEHRSGRVLDYDDSTLKRYFQDWQPATSAAVLGLDPAVAGATAAQPPQAVALPWAAEAGVLDPATRLDRVDRWNREESRSSGSVVGLAAGHKQFGPVSDELGRVEFSRYGSLATSVANGGFVAKVPEGYVGVQLLVDGASRAALITGPGLHRAIVAAAFGVDPLRVAVDKRPPMVHRSDVDAWPGVRSKLFSVEGALAVFDRMIAGRPPHGYPTYGPPR